MNKQKFKLNKDVWSWWIRSADRDYDYIVCYIGTGGSVDNYYCDSYGGVVTVCII